MHESRVHARTYFPFGEKRQILLEDYLHEPVFGGIALLRYPRLD